MVEREGASGDLGNSAKLLKKNDIKLVEYTFRLKNHMHSPPPLLSDFSELVPPLEESKFDVAWNKYMQLICKHKTDLLSEKGKLTVKAFIGQITCALDPEIRRILAKKLV